MERERGEVAGNARPVVCGGRAGEVAQRESEGERASERRRKDANLTHLEEGVQVMGQLGVTACVSTPLWQSLRNGKRRGPASSERA